MRWLNAVLAAILVCFAALQYNDPDWYFWGPVYLVAAGWAGLAAWQPAVLSGRAITRWLAVASAALFLVGFASLEPAIGRDWIHVEEARESLGYLICTVSTALALWAAWRRPGARVLSA